MGEKIIKFTTVLSSATVCTDVNGYVYAASTDANLKFTASFCRSGINDTVIIESTSAFCSCNIGSSCIGENSESYAPRTAISISVSNTTSEIFQYCDWLKLPCCSDCSNNESCTITMITLTALLTSNFNDVQTTTAMHSSILQMDFF